MDLPTGERKTVEYSRGVRERIRRGFYVLVSGPVEDESVAALDAEPVNVVSLPAPVVIDPTTLLEVTPEPEPEPEPEPVDPPARNASRAKWAAFLTSQGVAFTDDDGRDDLIALWDNTHGVG
ncbi:hypothetical protein [Mycolicibacterium canariasense]|uniref:hypothetical protein n=1 Tax=Mycolicibacterium canariasense TaxID=228230 RepID=UPI0010427E06|nr:hypothetical protein [Mycolicibacterium canariasense]MCV7210153.1 hypothetical protein [Mycolicibacterium canariasense]